jgi:hypothetical protein
VNAVVQRLGAGCLAVALAAGVTGCRARSVSGHGVPAVPPSVTSTDSGSGVAPGSGSPSASGSAPGSVTGSGSIGQQDVDNLNGILSSVGGAVTSVRSEISGDSAGPR